METDGIKVRFTGDTSGLEDTLSKLQRSVSTAFTTLIGGQVVDKLLDVSKYALEVTGTFERLGAVLENQLGSQAAGLLAFQKISDFAATTNFSVKELTESFTLLKGQGFEPTTAELRKLGDLANSKAKSFKQLSEAILDAQTGEFERLKEFGVISRTVGDTVTFTFNEQETTVKKTSSAIRGYLLSLGDLNGVQGATAKIAKTLEGTFSNLGDATDRLANTVGGKGSAGFGTFVQALTRTINTIEELIAGEDELAARQIRRSQNQVKEGLGDAVLSLAKDYQALGLATDEARKKAESYFSDSARQNILQTSELLKQLEQERSHLAQKAYPEQGLFLDPLLLANERNDLADLDKRIAALKQSRAVSEAYVATLGSLANATIAVEKPTKEQLKVLNENKKILSDLDTEFRFISESTKIFGEKSEETTKKINALKTAIEGLLRNGQSADSPVVEGLNTQFKDLTLQDLTDGLKKSLDELPEVFAPVTEEVNNFGLTLDGYGETITRFSSGLGEMKDRALDLGAALEDLAVGGFTVLGEALGGAFDNGKQFAAAMMGVIGDVLNRLGKSAIAIGVGMLAIKASFTNPASAIAAGVALVALSAAIGKAASIVTSSGGSAVSDVSKITSGLSGGLTTPNTNTRVVSVGTGSVQGSSISEFYLSGSLRIVDQNGALVGYLEKQKIKLGKTGG